MSERVDDWYESYKGWKIHFVARARDNGDGVKIGVYVHDTLFFNLITRSNVSYKETANSWVTGEQSIESQVESMREAAHRFVDSMECAKDLYGFEPNGAN